MLKHANKQVYEQNQNSTKAKAPRGTFTQLPNVLLDTCDLSDESLMLFSRLLRQVGHRGCVFHGSIRKLASTTQIKRDKAHRNLKILEAAGLVITGTSEIQLCMDDLWRLNNAYHNGAKILAWTNLQDALKLIEDSQEQDNLPSKPLPKSKTYVPYAEYLQSPEWKEKQQKARQFANHRCQVCNSSEDLNVHHRTYDRLGHEHMGDLIVLCRNCHEIFHNNAELNEEESK